MKRRLVLLLAFVGTFAAAAPLPYDESVDANAALQQALSEARAHKRTVLVIFGANWCEDCHMLDKAMNTGRNAALLSKEFAVVKVDVGRFNRNLEIDHAYGNPIKKGIPAALVLSPDNRVLYSTKEGELATARRMSETGIYDFFEGVVKASRDKP